MITGINQVSAMDLIGYLPLHMYLVHPRRMIVIIVNYPLHSARPGG